MEISLNLETIIGGVLEETAAQLKSEIVSEGVIPKNEGTLVTSHHVNHPEARRAEIATDIPYARRLYFNPDSVPVKEHERKGAEVREHTRKGRTVKAHTRKGGTVKAYTAGKIYNFRKGKSPNAKDHWFEDWQLGGKYENRAAEIYAEKLKKRLGGG